MCYGYFEKSTETRNTSPPLHMYCICLVVERVVYPKSNLMKIGCRQVEPGFFPSFLNDFVFAISEFGTFQFEKSSNTTKMWQK